LKEALWGSQCRLGRARAKRDMVASSKVYLLSDALVTGRPAYLKTGAQSPHALA
jgi:hypothetical protein